jgi:catechol 2,3-dioxygenase-like lactoylglutathione lyase family enzyme
MSEHGFPRLRSTVLDTEDVASLAEFYRRLLGWSYLPGQGPDDADADEWVMISGDSGTLAFQHTEVLPRSTWPSGLVHQQEHLDFAVDTVAELEQQHQRALELGATVLEDSSGDPDEDIYIYADPSGHPFCIFVHPGR